MVKRQQEAIDRGESIEDPREKRLREQKELQKQAQRRAKKADANKAAAAKAPAKVAAGYCCELGVHVRQLLRRVREPSFEQLKACLRLDDKADFAFGRPLRLHAMHMVLMELEPTGVGTPPASDSEDDDLTPEPAPTPGEPGPSSSSSGPPAVIRSITQAEQRWYEYRDSGKVKPGAFATRAGFDDMIDRTAKIEALRLHGSSTTFFDAMAADIRQRLLGR